MVRFILISLLLLIGLSTVQAQTKRQQRKESNASMQDQQARKQDREAQFEQELDARRNKHMKQQTKQTRKRMKKNRKRSERIDKGTHLPFYKRWFRKKHFK